MSNAANSKPNQGKEMVAMDFAPEQTQEAIEMIKARGRRWTLVVNTPRKSFLDSLRQILPDLPSLIDKHSRKAAEEKIATHMAFLQQANPFAKTNTEIESANARLRNTFLERVTTMSSREVHEAAAAKSKNRSLTANRWKKAGRIFAVEVRGEDRYPKFQFRDGAPLPVIKDILKALPKSMSNWQIALWFFANNGWLGGKTPIDTLRNKASVIQAAKREDEDFVG